MHHDARGRRDAREAPQVRILDEAVEAAVKLSHRYIPAGSCPTSRSACSTPPAPASRSASTPTPAASRTAGAGSRPEVELGDPRARGRASGADTSERRDETASSAEAEAAAGRARDALGRGADAGRRDRELARPKLESRAARTGGAMPAADRAPETPRRPSSTPRRRARRAPGRAPADAGRRSTRQTIAEVVAGWTGIPVGRMVAERDPDRAEPRRDARGARHRPGPRARGDRPADPDGPRRPRRPAAADRRLPARRPQRRRQDRDRPGPGRHALRRRAEPDLDQHVGVPGGAHGLGAEGLAARLCRLRRGRAC